MAYNTKYQSHFSSLLSEDYELFFDFKDYIGNASELTVSDVSERSVAGDQDRLFPILGKELLISLKIGANDQADISDLIATHDSDIRVTLNLVRADSSRCIVFQGFVVVEDNNQPLQDKPFNLQIRALDGLGLLKGVDLVDQNGNVFTGAMTLIEWVANILYKTNQVLPIRTYFNFFPANLLEQDPFDQIALNARTFQKAENPPTNDPSVDLAALNEDDCFTALEKIIRCFRCKIFMEDGRWNIVHLWDYMNPNGYGYTEYSILDPVSGICPIAITIRETGIFYDAPVGKEQIIYPFKSDASLYLKLATKWIKLTYNYDQSQNKVCNQKMDQGLPDPTNNSTIPSTIQDPTILPPVTLQTKGFIFFCWTKAGGTTTAGSGGAWQPFPETITTDNIFVRSVQDQLNYEIIRYGVIPSQAAIAHVRSSEFQIDANDAIEISFDWRLYSAGGSGQRAIAYIFLRGDDGSFWGLGSPSATPNSTPIWQKCDSNYYLLSTPGLSPFIFYSSSDPTVQPSNIWNNFSISKDYLGLPFKAPVSGNCFIILNGANDGTESWFKNIQITIVPYLQGSYQVVKGDYNFSEISDNIKQTESDNVEISDSPKRYFKGALLENDLKSLLVADWHRKGISEHFRFTQGQERLMWNLLKRIVYKIEGTFKGHLYLDKNLQIRPSGFLNSYYFVDTDFPTKRFICTSYDRSITEGNGRHVFVEVVADQNSDPFIDPSIPPNTFKFDYIF